MKVVLLAQEGDSHMKRLKRSEVLIGKFELNP